LEEEKDCLCGYPGYQQEGANSDSQHDERPEMMIIRLSDAVGGFDDAYGWFRGHNSYERIGIAALLGRCGRGASVRTDDAAAAQAVDVTAGSGALQRLVRRLRTRLTTLA
jgi:hypothetical protein